MDFVLSTGVTDYYYQISSYMTPFSPPKKGRFEGNRYEGMQNEESRKIGKGN